VEVMTIISDVTDEYDRGRLPSFPREYKVSYTALDDQKNSVIPLYALSTDLETPQVLIIDKEGIVRHVGKSTPWTQMAEDIEQLRGRTEPLDLSTVELATRSLKNPDDYVRWKAAEALGEMGDEAAVPALIEALSDEVSGVREFAARALGEISDSRSVEPLITALEDKSNFVRLEAVKALEMIPDERAISPLTKSLADAELQQNAANALAAIGKPELVNKALKENRAILQRGRGRELAGAYSHLGRAYKEGGMYDAAIAAYEKATKLTTDSYYRRDYVKNLVECYMETGSKEKAATAYLTMIKRTSASGGGVTLHHGDGTVEKFSETEWIIRDFVESFHRQGRLGELAEILEMKLPGTAKDMGLYETLASIYEKLEMTEKVIPMSEKVAELQSRNMRNHARLALAYNRAGMRDKAVAIAKEMAKRVQGEAFSQNLMVQVYRECEMYDESIALLKKSLQSGSNPDSRKNLTLSLAENYARSEQTDKIISLLSDASKAEQNAENKALYVGMLVYYLHQAGEKEKLAQLAPGSFVREAESADNITGAFQLENDKNASSGKFLWAPEVTAYGEGKDAVEEGRDAIYDIKISQAGDYKIIARALAPDGKSNSFFVKFDSKGNFYTWDPILSSEWKWQMLTARPPEVTGPSGHWSNQLITFPLSAGEHQFKLRVRERRTQVDVLVFYRLR